MKTSYISPFSGRGPKRPRLGPRVAALLVFLGIVVGAVLLWRPSAAGALQHVVAPLLALRNALGSTDAAQARAALARAEAAAADRELLQQDNIALRALLGRRTPNETRVLAAVLSRPPATPYDTLLLDVGVRHGVAVGQRVAAGGALVLGEVSEVYDSTATVVLYSAPGRELQATVLHAGVGGQTATPLVLGGQGAGSFVAEVPAGTHVAAGDAVVFANAAFGMPGVVASIVEREGESFVQVYVHLPVNLFELRYVEVIQPQ